MPAVMKLAAIFVFPDGVTSFIPWMIVAWLVAVVIYWGLLEWLFELDSMETIMLAIVICLVNAGAVVLLMLFGLAIVR